MGMSKKGGAGKNQPAKAGFDANKYVRPGLSVDEAEELQEAFDLFDHDLSGAISVAELTGSMKALGFDSKHAAVFDMVAELDADGNGEIDFDEFLAMMTAKIKEDISREEVEKLFKLFDSDRTGEISLENMKRVARELGENVEPQEFQEIIQRNDKDNDGALTFEDFYVVMVSKSLS